MIHLTPYEQRMLDGEFGAAKQVALQKIIDYAQILGATELVPITKAHLCCGSTCEPSDFRTEIWTAPTFWPWATTTGRPS